MRGVLTAGQIDAYSELIINPDKHGLDFKPLAEIFEKSDSVTAQHILYGKYMGYLGRPVPKLVFYIAMQEVYGQPSGKDRNGDLGYLLTIKTGI